jgi:hypothetical protein
VQEHEESRLDFLLGEWISFDRTYPGPSGPGGTSRGSASYRWEVGGKWLLYEFHTELPGLGTYEIRGGVMYEPTSSNYNAFAINNLGSLLVYEGRWEADSLVFMLTYPQRQEATRISYRPLPDGTVRMTSERPGEEGDPEVYFETLLSR